MATLELKSARDEQLQQCMAAIRWHSMECAILFERNEPHSKCRGYTSVACRH